jgi:hypothetical protein
MDPWPSVSTIDVQRAADAVAEDEALPRQLAALLMSWTPPEGASRQWTASALVQVLKAAHLPEDRINLKSSNVIKQQILGLVVAPFALVLAVDASPAKAALTYNIYESLGDLVV